MRLRIERRAPQRRSEALLRPTAVALLAAFASMGGFACAELRLPSLETVLGSGSAPLDETTIAAGLRQALDVGTREAAKQLSAPGGFSQNPALRLVLPDELDPMVDMARRVGLGSTVDRLETGMNRAAERAAGESVPIFASAVQSMTIQDALGILTGPDDAATVYFEERTSDALRQRFAPVVRSSMQDVGVYAVYQGLVQKYEALPFAKPVPPSLEDTITDQTLAALFSTLAQEEARIREDPAARTSALLRRVFGSPVATESRATP